MYSSVMHKTDTQYVYTLYVDDKPLLLNNLSFVHNDVMLVSLSRFDDHQSHNEKVHAIFDGWSARLLNKSLPAVPFSKSVSGITYLQWLKNYLQSIHVPVNKLEVYANKYVWAKDKLIPAGRMELKNYNGPN